MKACLICRGTVVPAGEKKGVRVDRIFRLQRCVGCGFASVENPWTDYAAIYDEAYYAGRGSDPLVDYAFEYENPDRTIRIYEWNGIVSAIARIAPTARTWLDFGCGNGGLVRHVGNTGRYDVSGFDTGFWAERARNDRLPVLLESELPQRAGSIDVVTAIEVIEHAIDPVAFLREIRKLCRPGALLFLTTQNASNAPRRFVDWSYVVPEIHVSFFTPKALALALELAGFQPVYPGLVRGWEQILQFKILKNLGFRRTSFWQRLAPWRGLAHIVDRAYNYAALPMGIAR
jgi:SAM-dependent methyltransferase